MPDGSPANRTIEILIAINTALTNLRLYPPTSAMIQNTLEKLHRTLGQVLEDGREVVFAEAEKTLLVNGAPLGPKDQERPQVAAFLQLLMNAGIRNLTLSRGLEKDELLAFLQILSEKPELPAGHGWLRKTLEAKGIVHIRLGEKVYVVTDGAKTAMGPEASPDIGKPDAGEAPAGPPAAAPPQEGKIPRGRNKGVFRRQVAELETMIRLHEQAGAAGGAGDAETAGTADAEGAARGGDATDRDRPLEAAGADVRDEPTVGGRAAERDDTAERADRGSAEPLPPTEAVADAPAAAPPKESPVERIALLYARGESARADEILDEVFSNLASREATVRDQAAEDLARILPGLLSGKRYEPIVRNLETLTAWIGRETAATPAFVKLCRQLGELGQGLIRERRFSPCRLIVKVFHQIHTGALERNDKIQEVAEDVMRDLSQADLIDILFKMFQTRDRQPGGKAGGLLESDEAGRLLVRMEPAAEHFLELLQKSESADERIRIMNLVNDMGTLALSAVLSNIRQDGVWYYQRNLARLLGRIGRDIHVRALQPLLLHADRRVQKEALKSIHGIGGDERGPLLTETLPEAKEALQLDIVPLLGSLRYPPAVPALIDLLKAKPVKSSAAREELEEKVCAALGTIGEESALAALTSIQRQIGILSLRAYGPRVKAAAGRAIAEIERKRKREGGSGKR